MRFNRLGAAAVAADAVMAGIIASSNGNATAAPVPRSKVRRERWDRFIVLPV
ncbi:secreted protein [Rhodopirellula baltica WH47]|uniref:Secreted protein n=1 Tax=Rhodopirellula baltica WH47 TaxID=991778 RepID=F2AZE2_RHOBT|nr:secreted protein [Rhodopirellula baltica WH47]